MLNASEQQKLITALHSQQQPPTASEVLGYSAERLDELRQQSGHLGELIAALKNIGINNYVHYQQGSREIVLELPASNINLSGDIERRQRQSGNRLAEHLIAIVPEQERLAILFSPHPESALFDLLPAEQLVVFIPGPTGRQQSPEKGWTAVTGGWKKRNLFALEQSFFLRPAAATEPQGLLTSQNIAAHVAQWQKICADHWLSAEDRQRRQQAVEQWQKIDHCQELIDQYQEYCQEQDYELQYQAEEVEDLQAEHASWQEEIVDLNNQLQRARSRERVARDNCRQKQRALQELMANKDLDRRQKIISGCNFISQAQKIAALPAVVHAEVIDPLSTDSQGPDLYLRCQLDPNQDVIEFTVSAGQVLAAEPHAAALQSRQLAIAEKFAAGQWVEMIKIILGALRQ